MVKNVMTLPGVTVLVCLESCNVVVAEEVIYHSPCMTEFCVMPMATNKKGRPADPDTISEFDRVCNWLEEDGDCELYTIKEKHQKMTELAGHSLVYSEKGLKEKLKTHYKEQVYFTELPGRADIVCFKDMASFVI